MALWIASATLFAFYAWARLDGEVHRRHDLLIFSDSAPATPAPIVSSQTPDQSLWSKTRIERYRESLALDVDEPLAVLRIAAVNVDLPIHRDTSDVHLNRGAGVIEGMSSPGEGGNLGIAGHRDGYFRVLKDVRPGAAIDVTTPSMHYTYRVTSIDVVASEDVRLLADTDDPTITLVTCFPFYYLGSAPQRYIVRGALERSTPRR